MTDIRKQLDDLAEHVAKEAKKSSTLQESIDALDTLTKYYAATQKHKGAGENGDDSTNFGAFSDQINGAESPHGRAKPPSDRRRDS